MASETPQHPATSSSSSSRLQSVVAPNELLLVLNNLHKKQIDPQHCHGQHRNEQEQLKNVDEQCEQHTELSQIELIYRAEGNANLVLALPQFKKVLRLPKIQQQLQQQQELKQLESVETKSAGILTMDHYVAYISIIRCLMGNEFVFEADVVAVPNPNDRHWINEHIKPHRPANRLDKEFGGHFGLLLPDATQLPAEFDILFSRFQSKTKTAMITAPAKSPQCATSSSSNTSSSSSSSNNKFDSDTFAIEIKPKQGWLLPRDVNNLFDIKPMATSESVTTTAAISEIETTSKAAVATTVALKASTDGEVFTATQNKPATKITRTAKATQYTVAVTTSADNGNGTSKTPSIATTTHSLHDQVDLRCRYCSLQFLKLKQHKIDKRSQYCPIDLFSGIPDRMLFALQALFECPQNNLRVFQNGQLVFADQLDGATSIEEVFPSDKLLLIKRLLVTCLLREYGSGEANDEQHIAVSKQTKQQQTQQQHRHSASVASVILEDGGVAGGVGMDAPLADGQPQSSVTSNKKQKLNTMPVRRTTTTATTTTTTTSTTTTITEAEVTTVKSTLTAAEPILTVAATSSSIPHYSTPCLQQINTAEVTRLPRNCILQKILHLQLLAKINLQFMLDHEYADKTEKTYAVVHKLLEKFSKNHNELTFCQLSPEEQYFLAATALDCSIMITFCEIENVTDDSQLDEDEEQGARGSLSDNPYVVSLYGKTFLTKVTLMDLDPKPDAHFQKYCHQTRQIAVALKDF